MNMSQKVWCAVCLNIILHPHLGAANLSPRALLHTAALNRHTSLSPYPDSPATPPDSQPTSARSHTDDPAAPAIARVPSGDSPIATPSSTPPNPSPITVSLLTFTRDSEQAFGSLSPDRSEQLAKLRALETVESLSLSSDSSATSASSPYVSQHPSPLKSKPATPELYRVASNMYHAHVYKSPSPEEATLWQKYNQQEFKKSPSTSDIASQAKDKEPTDEKNPTAKALTALSMVRRASGPSPKGSVSH
jgi:hypothetical protein